MGKITIRPPEEHRDDVSGVTSALRGTQSKDRLQEKKFITCLSLFDFGRPKSIDGKLNQYDPGDVSVDMELTNHNDTDFKMNLKVLDLLQSFNHNCVL